MAENEQNLDSTQVGNLDPSKIKIVIGMTGKIDSTITAFLLQKQGYQCIGVGIMSWNQQKYKFNLDKTCSVNNLDEVKAICEKLNMPFYAVDAQKEYAEKVMDQFMVKRVQGESTYPCHNCHQMKLSILYEKMKLLGADLIATGHFAKCYKNHANNTFTVHSSVDKTYDQSHLIASADQDILRKLVLPLAELHREEVVKLSKKFHLGKEAAEGSDVCYNDKPEIFNFIQENIPEDFRNKGGVIDVYTSMAIQEHQGVYNYQIGQKANEEAQSSKEAEPKVVVDIDYPVNSVFVGLASDYQNDFYHLARTEFNHDIDQSRPMTVMAKFISRPEFFAADIRFKNNYTVTMALHEKLAGIAKGELVFFYNKDTSGAKLLGKGVIAYMGEFDIVNRGIFDQTLQENKKKLDENGNPIVKEKVSEFRF